MLDELKHGTVIVEGNHDVKALEYFGVSAIPYPKMAKSVIEKKVYFFMDNDRGGLEKAEKAKSRLLELGMNCKVNEVLGKKMLSMLNATCVEQIKGPIDEAMERMERKRKRM
jgi:5S rRNA maturation endonuclease (ribonuclease M5)